jgi:peptidyl-prolyl cis-trans isomerase SurA
MKKITLLSILFIIVFSNNIKAQEDQILLTINGNSVYKSEFEQIYWKNKKEEVATKEDLNDYIKLFKNFKLKVAAAEEMGLDTIAKFITELGGYKVQLENPYLVDTSINQKLIEEAYYRTVNEISASHILVKVGQDANAYDTSKAFEKIKSIRRNIVNKEYTFKDAAVKFSEDPSAKRNNGYLGFFGAFKMVYSFENACYNTKAEEVSQPFRSQFGYHIVQIHETRKGRGKVKVAHIMVSSKKDDNDQTKQNAKKKIEELYNKANSGSSFEELAKEFSDDRNSARKGGELDWIESSGNYYKEFENAVFSIEENDQLSEPFLTPAGWHFIKRLDYIPLGDFRSLKNELKNKIKKNIRADISKKSFISTLKKEYLFTENLTNLKAVIDLMNNKGFGPKLIEENQEKLTSILFSFSDLNFSQYDFAKYLAKTKARDLGEVKTYVNKKYESYVNDEIIAYEKTRLEIKHPSFKALLKEYRDGILLFEISDQMIWSKAIKDTTGLKTFHQNNKTRWMWGDRLEIEIFSSANMKSIKKAYSFKKKGKLKNDSILNYLNKESQLNIKFEEGKKNKAELNFTDTKSLKLGLIKPFEFEGKYYLVNLIKEIPASSKELHEAEGIITAAYQEFLEKEWVAELSSKYRIEVNYDVLHSIVKKPQ